MLRKTVQLLLFLLASASLGFGQQEQNCPAQPLIVNVTDSDDVLVPGLQPNNFHVVLQGKPLNIISAQPQTHPVRVVILLDTSGSILTPEDTFDLARRFAGDIRRSLKPGNELALLTFSSEIKILAGLSSDRNNLVKQFIALSSKEHDATMGRQTAFFDALMKAASLFGSPQPGDAIYVITDGGDNSSRHHFREAKQVLIKKGIRLFCALVIPTSGPRTSEEELGSGDVWDLVQDTGGFGVLARGHSISLLGNAGYPFQKSPKGAEVESDMSHVYARIQQFYLLQARPTKAATKAQSLKVSVIDDQGKPRKDLIITYPAKFLPCSM